MKRNILDERTPKVYEGILKSPSIGETMGAYRMSTSSNQTFATTTTRASSVMPPARPNLGTSASMSENMTAEEAREYYGNTAYGQKNQEVTGNTVLPLPVATTINQQTREAQDNAIKARNDKEDGLKSEAERKKRRRRKQLYLLLGLLGLVALVAIAGGAFASLEQSDDSDGTNSQQGETPSEENLPLPPNDELVPTKSPTLSPIIEIQPTPVRFDGFLPTSESNFEFMCNNFDTLMEGHIFCQDDSYSRCEDGIVSDRQNDCDCNCEGQLSAPFTCPPQEPDEDEAQCDTSIIFEVFERQTTRQLRETKKFTEECINNADPIDLCLINRQTLTCSENRVEVFTCETSCRRDACENFLITSPLDTRLTSDEFEVDFCRLVTNKRGFARCGGGNGKTFILCPDDEGNTIEESCIESADKCICEDGRIIVVNPNELDSSACGAPADLNEICPSFIASVPVNDALELLSVID